MTCSGSDHTADPGLGPRCSPGVQCSSQLEAGKFQAASWKIYHLTPVLLPQGLGKKGLYGNKSGTEAINAVKVPQYSLHNTHLSPCSCLFSSSILIPSVKLQDTLRACCSSPSQMGTSTGKIQPSHSMANTQPQKPGAQGNEERAPRNYTQP